LMFTHCFSNDPVCTPFRGALMSGQYSLYNGTIVNDWPLIPGYGKKFGEVLRDAGYRTGYIGKWHLRGGNRKRPIEPGAMRHGFDEVFHSNNCHVNFTAGKCFFWNENNEREFFDDWEVYGQTHQAVEYLEQQKNSDDPFALFVSWHPPHDIGKFMGKDNKKHYRYDAPKYLMKHYDRDSIQVRPGQTPTPDLLRMYHGYMAMITGVDSAFGMIMDKLHEIGKDDNTIVVFTSDHGDMLEFDNAIYPKQYPHDYSNRIPFIIKYPGKIKSNTSTKLLFSALDMMPSILGIMQLEVPQECHGKNLSEAIFTGNEDAVDYIPVWLHEKNNYRGVITKDYTYAFSKNAESHLHNTLFDRNKDPYQLKNLIYDSAYTNTASNLHELTLSWMNEIGDKYYNLEDVQNAMDSLGMDTLLVRPIDLFLSKN
ncbi:MAG: sulfatase-like hydrolase/transferase, partial [Bacteroidales bacterium]|nr:sulfatase-like hydrolase/transferase [Bacteroidales bacterium]